MNIAFVGLIAALSLTGLVFGQQMTGTSGNEYSPDGAVFAMSVPSRIEPAQGYIFDPEASRDVYSLISEGQFKVFNFETRKAGKRQFLVSVLQVRLKKHTPLAPFGKSQRDRLMTIIGDDVITGDVIEKAGDSWWRTQWPYRYSLDKARDTGGIVHVYRTNRYLIAIVVSIKSGERNDPELQAMLDSVHVDD